MNTPGLISVNGIVTQMQNAMQDWNPSRIRSLQDFVIRSVTDLNVTLLSNIKVAYITPNPDSNIAVLPSDYVEWTKVGVIIGGHVWTLSVDESIALPRNEQCGVQVRDMYSHNDVATIAGLNRVAFAEHLNGGIVVSSLYGIGGGYNYAYFRIDREQRTIVLDGKIITDQIVLEYKSSGVSIDSITYMPIYAREACIAQAFWYMKKDNENYNANDKMMAKQTWEESMRRLQAYEQSLSYDEILDIFYAGTTQGVRRRR